ncbi:Dephospho-CoA kinase [hydrothermal vent metagenome]|uniref:Dephospho-CoA kinase n=1 Tax=hydrothermal vent metagenome TaxID=652676 RepID=A0A3B1BE61_9ZZZZ
MTQDKIIVIGLTGSIGMGKSETAKMFERAQIPVFDSDGAVHILMGKDGAAVPLVGGLFPNAMTPNGIDRKVLGARVFDDPAALKQLESILHPMVSDRRQVFFDQARAEGHGLVVMDVPLLFETGGEKQCDFTVVVSAPAALQRRRVLSRPGMTLQKFENILAQQMPDEEKRRRADFIVQSDRGISYAEDQVAKIIKEIRAKKDK